MTDEFTGYTVTGKNDQVAEFVDDMTIYVKYEANHELDFAKKYNTANKPTSNKPADTGAAIYGFTFLCLSSLFAIIGYIVLAYKKEKMD